MCVCTHTYVYTDTYAFMFMYICVHTWASQGALVVKNPPPVQEAQEMKVQSLGWEDPLEWEMATHSSILAWRSPWTEEPGGL